jgi:hypothetical protein
MDFRNEFFRRTLGSPETKAIVAVSFGTGYIIMPLIVGIALFSEKRWMKMSSADNLLKSALRKKT